MGGIVGFDVMKSDEGGYAGKGVGHDESVDTVISDSGKNGALVALGNVTLDFDEGVVRRASGKEGTDGWHEFYSIVVTSRPSS